MAPSGVQKERMQEADMFVLDAAGSTLETPIALPPPAKPPKLSECSPLFMAVSSQSLHGQAIMLPSQELACCSTCLALSPSGNNVKESLPRGAPISMFRILALSIRVAGGRLRQVSQECKANLEV